MADEKILTADFRPRPPEMVVAEGEQISGPLKDILEEAAVRHGYKLRWRVAPFPQSLYDLKTGHVDIVPRVIHTKQRESFVQYLGPIGYQNKDIHFLVHKGQEGTIRSYDDLRSKAIGVKLKTAYFPDFDNDSSLRKETSSDDTSLARMFIGGRFQTVALLDKQAMEGVLAGLGFKDYAFADYVFRQKIGNFYGMSKTSANAALFPVLNETLSQMGKSGRISAIYDFYHVKAPLSE
ncbi:MAG: ABC transporter substrate-binding protein [Magnetococcales bacterium]|nr:ABC transporter substrate-binding protein [Magnetococcales bacterium]